MAEAEARIEAVKGVLASIFASQRALKALAPEFKWAGLGNLLGDFGEFVAIEHYGLKRADAGASGYDAIMDDGRTVQIKTNYAASQIGYRGEADMMLVIKVKEDADWEEAYFGSFEEVKAQSRYSARDNKHMIAMSKLRKLAAENG